jgi:hypothetical protein
MADGRDFTPISELAAIGDRCSLIACGSNSSTITEIIRSVGTPDVGVEVEAIDGEYTRVNLVPLDRSLDAITSFYKRTGSDWVWLTGGTAFDVDILREMGIPEGVLW